MCTKKPRVVLATDANPKFSFYVPITSLMWREVAGYVPLVLATADLPALVMERTSEIIRLSDIVRVEPPPQFGTAAAAQLVRLFAYTVPGIADDDWLLIGDMDAWPLQSDAFKPRGEVYLMYAQHAMPVYPMGYAATTAHRWYTLVGIGAPNPSAALAEFNRVDPQFLAGRQAFNYDEHFLNGRIRAWDGHPDRCYLHSREGFPCRGRIDRAAWPDNVRAYVNGHSDPLIDAHLPRPGWTDETWPKIRPLLELCLTVAQLKWCDDYRAEWRNTVAA